MKTDTKRWIPYVAWLLVPLFPVIFLTYTVYGILEWWHYQLTDWLNEWFE